MIYASIMRKISKFNQWFNQVRSELSKNEVRSCDLSNNLLPKSGSAEKYETPFGINRMTAGS